MHIHCVDLIPLNPHSQHGVYSKTPNGMSQFQMKWKHGTIWNIPFSQGEDICGSSHKNARIPEKGAHWSPCWSCRSYLDLPAKKISKTHKKTEPARSTSKKHPVIVVEWQLDLERWYSQRDCTSADVLLSPYQQRGRDKADTAKICQNSKHILPWFTGSSYIPLIPWNYMKFLTLHDSLHVWMCLNEARLHFERLRMLQGGEISGGNWGVWNSLWPDFWGHGLFAMILDSLD